MRATSVWMALYFMVTICIGVYLVLNLFLAILLENFSLNAKVRKLRSAAPGFAPAHAARALHRRQAASHTQRHAQSCAGVRGPRLSAWACASTAPGPGLRP